MSVPILLEGVSKSFGEVHALNGVNFSVEPGEIFGFLGPNGAGKTTTIRILTGFIRAGSGQATVLGMDAWKSAVDIKRRLGFLPDMIAFGSGLTGTAFLDYMARLRGFSGAPPFRKELLERLELSDEALSRKMKGYSTGMAKKVALVQAMQHRPDLLIMDEPTEGLDPLMRHVLFDMLRELRDEGATVFMSSHVLSDVEEICERIALIREGRIVTAGTVNTLRGGGTRTMEVEFKEMPPGDYAPVGAQVISRDGATLHLLVSGDINDVVRELAKLDLADLFYERQSLEDLFLGFYSGRDEARTHD